MAQGVGPQPTPSMSLTTGVRYSKAWLPMRDGLSRDIESLPLQVGHCGDPWWTNTSPLNLALALDQLHAGFPFHGDKFVEFRVHSYETINCL